MSQRSKRDELRLSRVIRQNRLRTRRMLFEEFERRLLLASDWQNPLNAMDVNDDGAVSPLDALLVINELN